jgi:hypothetical protein
VKAIVVIEVRHAAPLVSRLVSPAYEDGTTTEAGMIQALSARFARLREHRANGCGLFYGSHLFAALILRVARYDA